MTNRSFSTLGRHHEICWQIANDEQQSIPYVCHLLFIELYKRDIRAALTFFVESELFGFLFNYKGEFEMIPLEGGEQILFSDGLSIGPVGSTMNWDEFFLLSYIACSIDIKKLLIDRITNFLDNRKQQKSISSYTHSAVKLWQTNKL